MEAAQFIQNYLGARPGVPQQLGANEIANYGVAGARNVNAEMMADQNWLAGGLANQQFDQIGRVQGGFNAANNPYTQLATDSTALGLGQAVLTSGLADRLGGMSGIMTDRGWQDYTAGPNVLENQIFGAGMGAMGARADQIGRGATDVGAGGLGQALLGDATRRLQTAGRLTPQEERDAAQSTRASFAARGLATSAPAAMTEALNRDRFSRQRMAEDRTYAQQVQGDDIGRQQNNAQRQLSALQANQAANMNQMENNRGFMINSANAFNQNQLGRMGQAGNLLGLGSGLLTDAGNLRNAAANINYMGARQTLENDPYARALTPGMQLGQFAAGQAGEMAGTNFANLLDLGANTYGFNTNMGMDLYNSWINNATAAQTGAQAANAQRDAANISAAAARNAARRGPVQTVVGAIGEVLGFGRR
jgi:hypothetical protein